MPKLARKTSHVKPRQAIGVYDGPTPPPGTYVGVIRNVSLRTYDTGTQAFNVLVELEAPEGSDKAQFDGFPAWTRLFIGEHEAQIARENAFYQAVCGKSDVDVIFDDKSEKSSPPVTKIGGVNPVGKKVRVQLQLGSEYQGERRLEGDSIYAYTEKAGPTADRVSFAPAEAVDPDADLISAGPDNTGEADEDRVEVSAGSTTDIGAAQVDYHSLTLPLLKAYAAEQGVNSKQPKGKILAALDAKFAESGGGGVDPKTAADLGALTVEEIKAWAYGLDDGYEAGDLDEYGDKQALNDLLVDDELVTSF